MRSNRLGPVTRSESSLPWTAYSGAIDTERLLQTGVEGPIFLRRISRSGFPTHDLVAAGSTIARLGRDGPLRMFFGRGRRVQLVDGTEWRIKATSAGPYIVPIIKARDGVVAFSGPVGGRHCYGINGRSFGLVLVPLGPVRLLGQVAWQMRRHEDEVATIDADHVMHTNEPVPIPAVLLAFALIDHGIPGEAKLMPTQR